MHTHIICQIQCTCNNLYIMIPTLHDVVLPRLSSMALVKNVISDFTTKSSGV